MRANEQTSPAHYASISSHFYLECRGGGVAVVVAVAMAAVHSGIKLYEIDAFITWTKTVSHELGSG